MPTYSVIVDCVLLENYCCKTYNINKNIKKIEEREREEREREEREKEQRERRERERVEREKERGEGERREPGPLAAWLISNSKKH